MILSVYLIGGTGEGPMRNIDKGHMDKAKGDRFKGGRWVGMGWGCVVG